MRSGLLTICSNNLDFRIITFENVEHNNCVVADRTASIYTHIQHIENTRTYTYERNNRTMQVAFILQCTDVVDCVFTFTVAQMSTLRCYKYIAGMLPLHFVKELAAIRVCRSLKILFKNDLSFYLVIARR